MRERLLHESELTLSKAISAGHAAEEICKHARGILKSNETIDLHKIIKHSKSGSPNFSQATEIINKCKFCVNSHLRGKCPAYEKIYHNCDRKNRFKKCCLRNRKTLHEIEQTENESPSASEYEFFLDTINLQKNLENLINISQIKNEPLDWNIYYLSLFIFSLLNVDFP